MDIELYREKYNLIRCQFNIAEEMYNNCVEAKILAEETHYDIHRQIDCMETNLEEIKYLWNKRNLKGSINYLTENNHYIFSVLKDSTFSLKEEYDEIDKHMQNFQCKQESYMEELKSLNNEFNEQ